jgi:hypothetical protein
VVVSSQRYGVDGSYDLLSDLLEANGNSAFADLTYSADPAIRNEALRVKLQRAINYDSYQRFGRVSFSQLESFSDGLSSLFGSSRAANMQHLGRRYGFSEFATSVFSTDVRSDWLEGLARDNREFVDSMRGWSRHEALNVGTDVLLNGMDLITANGVNIISGANGLVSLFDQRYARQIGGALSHPGQLYQGAVQGMSEWFELSPGEKARGAGLVGMGLLAGGEISAAAGRALRDVPNSALPSKIGPAVPESHTLNFEEGLFTNRQVAGEEVFYKYHGVDNRFGRTHNYVTDKPYTSEAQLRNDLAILDEWGIDITHVTTFKPSSGTWISEGVAAPQTAKFVPEYRPGGGYQGLIDVKNLPKSSIIRTDRLPSSWYEN